MELLSVIDTPQIQDNGCLNWRYMAYVNSVSLKYLQSTAHATQLTDLIQHTPLCITSVP
jgi:hypothetical protein